MQKLLHFHLPKTGGTAIRHHLVNQLGEDKVSRALAGVRLADALIEWDQMTAISGHFFLRQGDKLPSNRYSFTVLRDPVDRFLSEFYFSKVDNSSRPLDRRTHTLDLDAYLHSLSDKECQAFSTQLEMLYPLGTDSQLVLTQNQKLLAALNVLNLFSSIAIQEELEDFTCMLDTIFHWPSKPPPRVNITSYRLNVNELSAPQRDRLKLLLEPEIELYQRAKDIFKKQRRQLLTQARCDAVVGPVFETTEPALNATANPPKNFGDLRCSIKTVRISGVISGDERVMIGEELSISIELEAEVPISSLNIGIAIKDDRGILMFGTNSMLLGEVFHLSSGIYVSTYRMLNRMPIGSYRLDVALTPTESHYEGCYHWIEQIASFDVYDVALTTFEGKILMDAQVDLTPTSRFASCSSSTYITANRTIRAKARANPPLKDFKAKIVAMCSPETLQSGSEVLLPVQIKNKGNQTWPAFGLQSVTLSYRWYTNRGTILVADGLRTQLPNDVKPNESITMALHVKVPDAKGRLLLMASLVQEGVVWFMERRAGSSLVFKLNVI
ncbi:MAG: Wzt carbohydrate-binding domain-containing protein [Dyella sp.]|uniref:Wzt carbohydrate-binding domain-containing protein n=1 Tax=Dyella sp. TaxID=1869338 RepID=UPI003F8126E8